ncbi:M28 family peptidase, partial [candidate division WOR-3 bacterium]|nr:M28 family peptidase [candidate division WOR-3 bacterium]
MKNYLIITILLISTACSADEMEFVGDNAYSILKKQCEFGARVPGSDAHTECVEYLVSELEFYADTVYIQEFEKPVSYNKKGIVFKNIIAVFNAEWNEEIMLCTHYDSRPFSSVKGEPTPGANDGASGTAVLLEIARIIN